MILALFTLPAALGIVAAYAFVAEFEGNMKVLGTAMALTGIAGMSCCSLQVKVLQCGNHQVVQLWKTCKDIPFYHLLLCHLTDSSPAPLKPPRNGAI